MMNYGDKTVERTVTLPNGDKKDISLEPISIKFEK